MSANQAVPEPKNSPSDARPEVDGLPLIQTKIRVPRRRADLLSRRRLVDFIHAHLDRKLILISAPAGYGKTSLLSDFAHDTELPVCWYTLDRFDCDLNVFLEHLIASIARRFPGFGVRSRAFLQNITNPGQNLYLTVATIVQEIYDAIPEYFVLILDDHHSVEDQDQINESRMTESAWAKVVENADKYYQPGVFTTFHGFEWTSMPGGNSRNWARRPSARSDSTPSPSRRPSSSSSIPSGSRGATSTRPAGRSGRIPSSCSVR